MQPHWFNKPFKKTDNPGSKWVEGEVGGAGLRGGWCQRFLTQQAKKYTMGRVGHDYFEK